MTSPAKRPPMRRPSASSDEGGIASFSIRRGTLASLIRNRSHQTLSGSYLPLTASYPSDDEESLLSRHRDGEDLAHLLQDERRLTQLLNGPGDRSMNLIGKSNPRYRWERYWKHESELKNMEKPIRKYYERTNELIQQYMYIDCLLDSSIPHDLLNEYSTELEASAFRPVNVPVTIQEESTTQPSSLSSTPAPTYGAITPTSNGPIPNTLPQKRTPKDIFRSSESMPLLLQQQQAEDEADDHPPSIHSDGTGPRPYLPWLEDAEIDGEDPIVTLAIWVNLVANTILLAGKIVVIASVPSMSVLASLVDAVLDFLSTAIVWLTMRLISAGQKDQFRYPVGRKRLEPVGVLVFSIIMITSFVQVGLECVSRLMSPEHEILQLGLPAIIIMVTTIIIKGLCWIWCRLVKNSSVRALAEDAKTDVIFNAGSILFPIVGFYWRVWWLDALGGLLLSMVVIFNWSQTSAHHVRNLTGFSAQPDERNLLLYLTMRFATSIRQIQNLRAYHAGDKLFVEADIVLPAHMPLKDSHDLSEVLTYFLESVPIVDRAFVHVDYTSYNAPTHILKNTPAN
ncbi:hypothetical protein NLU13_1797 [Sarocladium strictum]|uniref:Cation diffusion facilitator 10 n=1 Tax=Sarocladium strictum TaxID=5046 RepID=A0AA39GRW0_SARSR|nr:hypothetical protein NLU13_1797 [Sarocladium strictum]